MKLFAILLIAFCVRALLIIEHLNVPEYRWQQDNYVGYALGNYPDSDSRLFPGYPLLLKALGPNVATGVGINLFCALTSIAIFYCITKRHTLTFLFAIFPPIWVLQSTKVSTEPLTVLLLLSAFLLFLHNRMFFAGLIAGIAVPVRLIAIAFGAAGVWVSRSTSFALGFLAGAIWLFFYNITTFGPLGIVHQLTKNPSVGGAGGTGIGGIQILVDIIRAFHWGQYRILVSGLWYLGLTVLGIFGLYRTRNKNQTHRLAYFTTAFGLLFIFSLGPIPLLEEYSRFLVPLLPMIIIGLGAMKRSMFTHEKITQIESAAQ